MLLNFIKFPISGFCLELEYIEVDDLLPVIDNNEQVHC